MAGGEKDSPRAAAPSGVGTPRGSMSRLDLRSVNADAGDEGGSTPRGWLSRKLSASSAMLTPRGSPTKKAQETYECMQAAGTPTAPR